MKIDTAVFVTDGVNRQNIMLPLKTLVESMEGPLATAIELGIPYGMPANVGHDLCRPIGWSEPRGVYLAKDMARMVGQILVPENAEESRAIDSARETFVAHAQARQIEPHLAALNAKVAAHATPAARVWHVEATAGCCQSNRNLSPVHAAIARMARDQTMRVCHSAKAAERRSL